MKSVVVRKPGGHKTLELVEGPDPSVGTSQVRVRVHAIGVNFADCIVRMGHYEAAKGKYPLVPGFEFAGIVDAAGKNASKFKIGERVFGITRFGAYASSIAADEKQLWRCPDGWNFPECAAFPSVFLTAYHALFKVAKVEPGETLLIHSAAGGVGSAMIQLGRIAGCRLIGVVGSEHKAALCHDLGADAVIARSTQNLWKEAARLAPEGYDAIFDANGISTLRQGFDHLAHGGRLVVYGFADILPKGNDKPIFGKLAWNYLKVPKFSPFEMTSTNRAVMGFNVVFLFHKLSLAEKGMGDMLKWIREGKIKKVPVSLFPLEGVARAHQAIESGTTVGKLVLTV